MAVHHEMDDGDLPPVPLLPLSRPAVQALNVNPDASAFPESTGEDTGSGASHMVIIDDSAPASSSSFLETNENKDDDAGEEPPLPVGGASPPVPTSASTVTTPRPTPNNSDARPGIRALIDVLPLPQDGKSTSQDEDPAPGAHAARESRRRRSLRVLHFPGALITGPFEHMHLR